jgi:hypothetical protein
MTTSEAAVILTPPPNPFYRREYAVSIRGGRAWVTIPAPGNRIEAADAQDVIDMLNLIIGQLRRRIPLTESTQP